MPPALSVPTFSLARGGDYFFAARYTLVLSIVLPLLLLVLFLDHREVLGNAHALERFFVVLVVALALPCLLGQAWRHARHIAAGKLATNWSWVGALAMVPLAFLVALRADGDALPATLRHCGWHAWAALLLPFCVLVASRFCSALYLRLHQRMTGRTIHAAIVADIHLLQTSPNIFLWLSLLLPGTFLHAPTLVAGSLLGFFVFAYLDEALIVRRFRAQIAPAVATPVRAATDSIGDAQAVDTQDQCTVLDTRQVKTRLFSDVPAMASRRRSMHWNAVNRYMASLPTLRLTRAPSPRKRRSHLPFAQ